MVWAEFTDLGAILTDERVERRLAAILAADVAGFSALMERDEEGTYARIGALRREIFEPSLFEHQGRLIKTTGDGFLAEFASPLAALRCALAIQGTLTSDPDALPLRIGLNLGDVIIEEGGDVYGERIGRLSVLTHRRLFLPRSVNAEWVTLDGACYHVPGAWR